VEKLHTGPNVITSIFCMCTKDPHVATACLVDSHIHRTRCSSVSVIDKPHFRMIRTHPFHDSPAPVGREAVCNYDLKASGWHLLSKDGTQRHLDAILFVKTGNNYRNHFTDRLRFDSNPRR